MSETPAKNNPPNKTPFQLGALSIDPGTRRIEKGSESLTCEPKVFDMLLYFCAQNGEIITRDQLLEDIWQGRIVSDNAINRKIYQLRKILASLDQENEYIETIPKFGYRLSHSMVAKTAQPTQPLSIEHIEDVKTSKPQQPQPLVWLSLVVIFATVVWFALSNQPKPVKTPELKQLTSLQGVESDATLSPNGRYLLFSLSGTELGSQLILKDNQTDKRQILTDITDADKIVYDIRAQWHPSGEKIAFIRISNNPDERCVIFEQTVKPKLGKATKLVDCAYANTPSITWGSGTNKLFIAEREKKTVPYLVYSLDTSTGNKQQLTLGGGQSNMQGDYFVRRNLDGSQLTILRYIGSNQVRVGVYNSEPFALNSEFVLQAHISDIAWQPKTGWFYFRRAQHIYKVDEQGESEQQIFHLGSAFGGLSFSADGKQLLMSNVVNDTDIWQRVIGDNPPHQSAFIGSTKQDRRPRFANTSKALAFISNRGGKNAFWIRSESGQISKLTELDFDVGYPNFIWSPNDKHLLFEYQDQIYTLEIATGKLDIKLDTSFKAYVTTWSSDGKSLYYGSNKSGDWQLWSYNLSDKTSKQLTTNGGYSGYDNPVDGLFYFSKYHNNGLWRLNTDGSESLVIEGFSLLNWLNWRIVNNRIYYARLRGQDAGIYGFDLSTLQDKRILPHEKGVSHDYSVAFDNSVVTYTKHISQSGDVLALQF